MRLYDACVVSMQCVWCLNEFHEHVTGREVLHALRNYLYNRNDTPNDPYGPVSDVTRALHRDDGVVYE